ncbi:hypothetical protein ACLB2K_004794 [Fragaria x ananassa]
MKAPGVEGSKWILLKCMQVAAPVPIGRSSAQLPSRTGERFPSTAVREISSPKSLTAVVSRRQNCLLRPPKPKPLGSFESSPSVEQSPKRFRSVLS